MAAPVSLQLQHAGPWNPTGLLPNARHQMRLGHDEAELPGPDFAACRAMTKEEIEEQIEIWVNASIRVWKAGFDAVEINHGTCHQGNTFLSRVWNKRDDEYGPQSFENRTRFLCRMCRRSRRGPAPISPFMF